jgi:non-specific serine/threonine protein kinase/serine/threonine-protein kinase
MCGKRDDFDCGREWDFGELPRAMSSRPPSSKSQGQSVVAPAAIATGSAGESTATPLPQEREQSPEGSDHGELSTAALGRIAAAVTQDDSGPKTIGRYRLTEMIGEGGMGEVWRAEQEDPIRRTVALKLVKLGMDTREVIARFEAERQALAMINHPNVAKVLDAGATDTGRPYFVMEYVPGEPITAFCDRHAYTIKQRLGLFSQACAAVQHAHQKGILHRDLKPGNILVTTESGDAQVKVIDFGIAKALQTQPGEQTLHTLAGQLIGTPEYMSPEQALTDGQDVDTRSDVYSLGVVLYELLSGVLPFDSKQLRGSGVAGIQRIIREVDPPRPSTRLSGLAAADVGSIVQRRQTQLRELKRQLRQELEWIPLKAMRKDPAARYNSASDLAADVGNYIRARPLLAGPESRRYRLKKFVHRNKVPLAVTAVFVLTIVGATVTYVRGIRAEQAKTLRALAEARQVGDFQAEMLSGLDVHKMGMTIRDAFVDEAVATWRRSNLGEEEVSRRRAELESLLAGINPTNPAIKSLDQNIVERALKTIDSQFVDQPLVRARLLQTLTDVLRNLTLLDRATPPQMEALKIRQDKLGKDHPETLASMHTLVLLLAAKGQWPDAEPLAKQVLERRRAVLGENDPQTLRSGKLLAEVLQRQGQLFEAESYRRDVLERSERVLGERDRDTIDATVKLGQVLLWQERLPEAETYLQRALERVNNAQPHDEQFKFRIIGILAKLRLSQDRLGEAEELFRQEYEGIRGVIGDDHRETLYAMLMLGSTLRKKGELNEAEIYIRRAGEGLRRTLIEDHLDTLEADKEMALLREEQSKIDDAESRLRELYLKVLRLPIPPAEAAQFIGTYGLFLARQSRYGDAEKPLREAYARLAQTQQQGRERTRLVVASLAEVCKHTGRPDEAARWRETLTRLHAATQPAAGTTRPVGRN